MATPIPTRIKIQIRDLVAPPTSPLQTQIAALATTLGYRIALDPEWGMLWASLSAHYPDPSTFIPSAVGVLTQWCDAFAAWAEEDCNEVPVERLLDALKGVGVVRLVLEISPTSPRPTTTWRRSKSHFVLALPKARPSPQQTVLAGFASDFQALFIVSPSQLPAMSPSLAASSSGDASMSASAGGIDDWADLSLDSPVSRPVGSSSRTAVGKPSPLANVSNAHVPGDDPLPDIAAIERPEELCARPPYRLVVRQEGGRRVEVQGSHQGSLKVLEGYLKHWVRHSADYTNRPPLAEIKIKDSVFGLGLLYDTLTIESGVRGKEVNALLILKIVENVLGYEMVGDGGPGMGSVWEFRRLRGFK